MLRELTINTTVMSPIIEDEYSIFGGKTGGIWGTNEIDGYHMVLITMLLMRDGLFQLLEELLLLIEGLMI